MAFLDIEFPKRIAMGAMRTPGWNTTVVQNAGGYTNALQNWVSMRLELDVALAVRTATDYQVVQDHFHEVRGRAYVFPIVDKVDNTVTAAQGIATLVSGSIYQLGKRYGSVNPYDRKITRPVASSCTFYRTRAAVVSPITPTLDANTGRITVAGHVAGDTYSWAGLYRVPVRYAADTLPTVVVNRRPGGGDLLVQCDGIVLSEERE